MLQPIWDTHCHVFDPVRHPYITDTPYSPPLRDANQLLRGVPCKNFVIVMSVPEGVNPSHTLETIQYLTSTGHETYGTAVLDLDSYTDEQLQQLRSGGIRSIRIHLVRVRMTIGEGLDALSQYIERVAKRVAKLNWSIDAQLSLETWASLSPLLLRLHNQYNIHFVADHSFSATPDDLNTKAFAAVLSLVESGAVYVKVSGMDRFCGSQGIGAMRGIVQSLFRCRGGHRVLYGSDWPHVVMGPGGKCSVVDLEHQVELLHRWAEGEKTWERFCGENATELYCQL